MHTKALLTTTAILLASTSFAFAQTTGGPGDEASADNAGIAMSSDGTNATKAAIAGEVAEAIVDNGTPRAVAKLGDGVVTSTFGNGPGSNDIGNVEITGNTSANTQLIFEAGVGNSAINMQIGQFNQASQVLIGDTNMSLVSQEGRGHEASVALVGNENASLVVQNGSGGRGDHGAAVAVFGDRNTVTALQAGGGEGVGNFAAHAILGSDNTSVSYQKGTDNTLVSLQLGDNNQSYINQGGPLAASKTAINGVTYDLGPVPDPLVVNSSTATTGVGSGMLNSAASFQHGNGNVSGILQYGSNNEAVNYQKVASF